MKREERASLSIMKIICVTIILILISGIGVMAVNTNLKDIKIVLQNGYEMTVLTSKSTVSDVLEENNIVLDENEKTTPELNEKVSAGTIIKIVDKSYTEVQIAKVSEEGVQTTLDELLNNYAPITEKIVTEQVAIPYETITKNTAGTTENTPGEDEYIPDYEIPIDKTAEAGGVEAYVVEYNVYEVEPQYRLSFTTVDTLGYDEPTTSTWQTLSEIQGAVSQQ